MIDQTRGTPVFQKQRLPWPAILVFLFLAGAIATSGYLYYGKQKKSVSHAQITQLKAIADLKAAQIGNWLGERLADARLIVQDRDRAALLHALIRDRSNTSRRESALRWLSSLQQVYHYENAMLLDPQGSVVLAAIPHHTMVGPEGLKPSRPPAGARISSFPICTQPASAAYSPGPGSPAAHGEDIDGLHLAAHRSQATPLSHDPGLADTQPDGRNPAGRTRGRLRVFPERVAPRKIRP